jgi:inosine triphosphate pyrophosphatase
MHIHYCTSNQTKFDEACHILYEDASDKAIYDIRHAPLHLEEIQGSSHEIARHKAYEALRTLKEPVIIDDISVHFRALNNFPGPYIKAFLEALGDKGIYELISHYDNKECFALCTIAFLESPDSEPHFFEGRVEGTVVAPRGKLKHGKLSWNSIIEPKGFDKTYGELSLQEISRISPRGQALRQFRSFFKDRVS